MKLREVLLLFAVVAMLALERSRRGRQQPCRLRCQQTMPDVVEVRHYALTLDKAQKAATAMQSINQLVAANPALKRSSMNADSTPPARKPSRSRPRTIDSKYPQVAAIIQQNGLQTREFIVITGAIINDVGFVDDQEARA